MSLYVLCDVCITDRNNSVAIKYDRYPPDQDMLIILRLWPLIEYLSISRLAKVSACAAMQS